MIYKIFNREAIDLKYKSTRGNAQSMDSAEAIIAGLADDGGLFVPTGLPKVDGAFIEELTGCSYEERAKRVLSCFLTDYTPDEIAGCVGRAYGNKKFDNEKIAPVTMFDDVSVFVKLEIGGFEEPLFGLSISTLSVSSKKHPSP